MRLLPFFSSIIRLVRVFGEENCYPVSLTRYDQPTSATRLRLGPISTGYLHLFIHQLENVSDQ
jgi:hypothetical protein